MEAIEKNNASNTHQEKAKKLRKLRRWQIAVSLLGAAIVVWGIVEVACLFLGYNRTETSNDAQIEQYISPINLRASGYIKKIYFTEHQEVHKGDTLLVLDDREYKIRVMEAEAALKDALAGATVIGATLQPHRPPLPCTTLPSLKLRSVLPNWRKTANATRTWCKEMQPLPYSWNR